MRGRSRARRERERDGIRAWAGADTRKVLVVSDNVGDAINLQEMKYTLFGGAGFNSRPVSNAIGRNY
uniref:Uncharacterized protein n=1 Tax=Oryza meridionalis TaxID=40149 RepID=A0A0E0EJC5_9ORYZ